MDGPCIKPPIVVEMKPGQETIVHKKISSQARSLLNWRIFARPSHEIKLCQSIRGNYRSEGSGISSSIMKMYSVIHLIVVQRSAKVDAPGCVNAAGKLRQK